MLSLTDKTLETDLKKKAKAGCVPSLAHFAVRAKLVKGQHQFYFSSPHLDTQTKQTPLDQAKMTLDKDVQKKMNKRKLISGFETYKALTNGRLKPNKPIDESMTMPEILDSCSNMLKHVPLPRVWYVAENELGKEFARRLLDDDNYFDFAKKVLKEAEFPKEIQKEFVVILQLFHGSNDHPAKYDALLDILFPAPTVQHSPEMEMILLELKRRNDLYDSAMTAVKCSDWELVLQCVSQGLVVDRPPVENLDLDIEGDDPQLAAAWRTVPPTETRPSLLEILVKEKDFPFSRLSSRVSPANWGKSADWLGNPVLHTAVAAKNSAAFRALLKNGADINAVDVQGQTVLHHLVNEATVCMKSLEEEMADTRHTAHTPVGEETEATVSGCQHDGAAQSPWRSILAECLHFMTCLLIDNTVYGRYPLFLPLDEDRCALMHVVCAGGASNDLLDLVKVGFDLLQKQNGNSLLDTLLNAKYLTQLQKEQTARALLYDIHCMIDVPNLMRDQLMTYDYQEYRSRYIGQVPDCFQDHFLNGIGRKRNQEENKRGTSNEKVVDQHGFVEKWPELADYAKLLKTGKFFEALKMAVKLVNNERSRRDLMIKAVVGLRNECLNLTSWIQNSWLPICIELYDLAFDIEGAFKLGNWQAVLKMSKGQMEKMSKREITILMYVAVQSRDLKLFVDCARRGGHLTGIPSREMAAQQNETEVPSPLHDAIRFGTFDLATFVNDKEISFNKELANSHNHSSYGDGLSLLMTLLDKPLDHQRTQNMKTLFSYGANINVKSLKGKSVLQMLIDRGDAKSLTTVVREAVSSGQRIEWVSGKDGWTALHVLCDNCAASDDILFFIEQGADSKELRDRIIEGIVRDDHFYDSDSDTDRDTDRDSDSDSTEAEKTTEQEQTDSPKYHDGLTLIDTTILQHRMNIEKKIQMLRFLLESLQLGPYHAQVVSQRPEEAEGAILIPAVTPTRYSYPILHLLRPVVYTEYVHKSTQAIIRLLVENKAVGATEIRAILSSKQPYGFLERLWQPVKEYLQNVEKASSNGE